MVDPGQYQLRDLHRRSTSVEKRTERILEMHRSLSQKVLVLQKLVADLEYHIYSGKSPGQDGQDEEQE